MIKVTLSQIANITRGELFGDDLLIDAVSTDTRAIDNGALFVALVGERFDAHNFCQQAVDAGAGASRHLDSCLRSSTLQGSAN